MFTPSGSSLWNLAAKNDTSAEKFLFSLLQILCMILLLLVPLHFKFIDGKEPEMNFPRSWSREIPRIWCGTQRAAAGDMCSSCAFCMGSAVTWKERAAVTTFLVEFSEEVSFSNIFASHGRWESWKSALTDSISLPVERFQSYGLNREFPIWEIIH